MLHLNNVLMLPSENENITFHTFIMRSLNITCCIKHGVKRKIHQVQRKQIDSHKAYSKCLPPARTQVRKCACHWSTASSISECSKPCHTCSRHCHSSSMSWTLVSHTRCWMTDHKNQSRFSGVMITNVLPPFYGSRVYTMLNVAGWIYKSNWAVYKVHRAVPWPCGALHKPCSVLLTS